jgi:hypothetical protein
MQKNIQKYRHRKIYTKTLTHPLAPSKSLADGKNLAHPISLAGGKNMAHPKSLADGKNLAHPKSSADGKNLAHPKSLADGKNLAPGKIWRLQKYWRTEKARRPPMLA